jgi:hypothetical protein
MRDLSHRTCAVTPAPYPAAYREGRHSREGTGLLWTYLDADNQKVIQARTYDPEALAVSGPYAGDMLVMNWGGGRLTTGAFPQCADCMRAGKFVVPRFYEWSVPNWWLHVGAYCDKHRLWSQYPSYELHWSGVDLVYAAPPHYTSPYRR